MDIVGDKDLGKCSDEEKNYILILRKIKSNYEWYPSAGFYVLVMMISQGNKTQLLLAKYPLLPSCSLEVVRTTSGLDPV